jgi:GxxExxY protein
MDHGPHEPHGRLLHEQEAFLVRGAIFEVNRILGVGFLEAAYQESLALEFEARGIPFTAQPTLKLDYKGTTLRAVYIPDFICFNCILVELKAVSTLGPDHRAQVHNYLRAANLRVGLLVNFGGAQKAHIERIVR